MTLVLKHASVWLTHACVLICKLVPLCRLFFFSFLFLISFPVFLATCSRRVFFFHVTFDFEDLGGLSPLSHRLISYPCHLPSFSLVISFSFLSSSTSLWFRLLDFLFLFVFSRWKSQHDSILCDEWVQMKRGLAGALAPLRKHKLTHFTPGSEARSGGRMCRIRGWGGVLGLMRDLRVWLGC